MSAEAPTSPSGASKLRLGLIVVAGIEAAASLSNLGVFTDLSAYKGGGLGQWILFVGVAIFPVLSIAALVLAIKGDLRRAIMAIAMIVIVSWLTDALPSLFIHGLEFLGGGIADLHLFAQTVIFPLLAVLALALARRNERLTLAAVLASLTTVANVLGVLAFAVGVAIYGF